MDGIMILDIEVPLCSVACVSTWRSLFGDGSRKPKTTRPYGGQATICYIYTHFMPPCCGTRTEPKEEVNESLQKNLSEKMAPIHYSKHLSSNRQDHMSQLVTSLL